MGYRYLWHNGGFCKSRSLLHVAAYYGHIPLIDLLLERGAIPNAQGTKTTKPR
jgi:ankyrin repeat protein